MIAADRAQHGHRHARAGRRCTVALPRPGPRPALRRLRRRGAQPGHRDGPAGRRAARRRRPGAGARLLRRRARADRRRAGPVRQGPVRRAGVPERRRSRARWPARPGTHARTARRPADGRGQRDLAAATRAPAARRSCPATRYAKLSFRLVANQEPAQDHRAAVEAFVAAHTPAGITASVDWEGDGVAPAWSARHPRLRGADPGASAPRSTAPRCCRPARAAAARRRRSSRCSARRWCSSASGLPDDQIHAPNEKVIAVDAVSRAPRRPRYLWADLAELGRPGCAAEQAP